MKAQRMLIFLLWLPLSGYAQDSATLKIVPRKYWQFDSRAGYLQNDHASLNNSLQRYNLRPVSKIFFTYSWSAKYIYNRFVFNLGVSFFNAPSQNNPGNIKTTLGGSGADVSIGYMLVEKPKFRLYPFVGINQRFARLQFENTSPQVINNIGDIVNNPGRYNTVTFNSGSVDLGIQVERLFDLKTPRTDCPQNVPYLALGLRAGYHFPFNNGEPGEFNSQTIENAPRFGMKGPYVQLTIGIGKRIGQYKWK